MFFSVPPLLLTRVRLFVPLPFCWTLRDRNPSPFDISRLSSKSACLYKLRCTDGERNGNSDKEETQEKTNAREKFFYRRLLHTISSLTDKLFFLDRQASYCERQFQQLTFFPNLHARLHLVFFLSFLFPVACTLSSFRPGFLVSFFTLFFVCDLRAEPAQTTLASHSRFS